jgi:hypothetical protein
MTNGELRKKIFFELKKYNHQTLAELSLKIGNAYTKKEVGNELQVLVQSNWLGEKDGVFFLLRLLDQPMKELDYQETQLWSYDKIAITTAEPPHITINPYLGYMPVLDQGERGTCVGHASAYLAQANYYAVTKDFPTPEEKSEFKRALTQNIGACTLVYDGMYRTCFSPNWLYEISRIVGNVSAPSGSFCSASIEAMKDYGSVLWDLCLTGKFNSCAPRFYPWRGSEQNTLEDLESISREHQIDGYATARDFQTVMSMIENSNGRGVLMPINLYEDYQSSDSDGCLYNHPGEPAIGSHALWFHSVNRDKGYIEARNSWADQMLVVRIREDYFEDCAGAAHVPLDKSEVIIGRKVYGRVNLYSNVISEFLVGKDKYSGTTASLQLEKRQEYDITATALDITKVNEKAGITKFIKVEQDVQDVYFNFTKTSTSDWIHELIAKILKKILGR